MVPREEVDIAAGWASAAKALCDDGSRLDNVLRAAADGMLREETAEGREVYRGRAADVLQAEHSATVTAARDAADGIWKASLGYDPAEHGHESGYGLFHQRVYDSAACLFDGTGGPADFSKSVRWWLAGEYDRAYDKAMEDNQTALGDPGVRYAHVPTSPKPCEECCAIAANGFAYRKPFRLHSSCRCVIVAGRADTEVEGYDPDEYYYAYRGMGKCVIPDAKLAGYALNPGHPAGKHKAKVFGETLGITAADADYLAFKTYVAAGKDSPSYRSTDEHGGRYICDFILRGLRGKSDVEKTIRAAWIFRVESGKLQLTTIYVK